MLIPLLSVFLFSFEQEKPRQSGAANKQFLNCRTFYLKTGFWYQDATM